MTNGDQKEKVALLVVDMQYIHVHPDYSISGRNESETSKEYTRNRLTNPVLPALQQLLTAWRRQGGLVVHIAFNHRAPDGSDLGPDIYSAFVTGEPDPAKWAIRTKQDPLSDFLKEVAPVPGEIVLEKTTYSAFDSSNLDFVLKNHNITSLVVVGGLTNCCVRQTAESAKKHTYNIYSVPDAVVDRSPEAHEMGLRDPGYARLLTTEEAVDLLP